MKYIFTCALLFICSVPQYTHAETVLRFGENVTLDADQTVTGDFYTYSKSFGNTSVSGEVKEDFYAVSGTINVNGTVGKDLSVLSGVTHIYGPVNEDVRIVGGEVTIADHIGGDLFVIAGSLTVLSSASIDGDVIFYGESAFIDGKVGGSVLGTSNTIRVDAEVGKNIDVKTTNALTLGDKAHVKGVLTYTSINPLIRSQNALVDGQVTSNEYLVATRSSTELFKKMLIPLFINLFATLSLYLFFRKQLYTIVSETQSSILKNALFGFFVIVIAPVASIVLIATMLGSLVGVLVLTFTTLIIVLSISLVGCVLGVYLSKWITNKTTLSLPWIVGGTIVVHILFLIPYIGVACSILLCMMTSGGIVRVLYKSV